MGDLTRAEAARPASARARVEGGHEETGAPLGLAAALCFVHHLEHEKEVSRSISITRSVST